MRKSKRESTYCSNERAPASLRNCKIHVFQQILLHPLVPECNSLEVDQIPLRLDFRDVWQSNLDWWLAFLQ